MRTAIAAIVALSFFTVQIAAQEQTSPQDLIRRAVALHDSGDFDAAIAIYRKLLETMPDNEGIKYELTFSTFAKGDMAETIRLAKPGAEASGRHQVQYLELLGNAYDAVQRPNDAVDAYKRGIAINPKYARIHYNLAVTYTHLNKLPDARSEFERAIELQPNYASAHYAVAEVYRNDGYRVPAILAHGRYLSLATPEAKAVTAARNLVDLLNQGVESKGPRNVNITIDPKSKKDLGDFSTLEMLVAMSAASRHLPENASKTAHDQEAETLASFLSMLAETAGDYKTGFVAKTYVPFYAAVVKAGHVSAFAHAAVAPLNLPGTREWQVAHTAELTALGAWLQSWR